jgi:hypothetical protein
MYRSVFVAEWLCSAIQVDDTQTTVAESDSRTDKESTPVRPSMRNGRRHVLKPFTVYRSSIKIVN